MGAKSKRIDRHGQSGCSGCGTNSIEEGGNGQGGCYPMTDEEVCRCPFCVWKNGDGGKREMMGKVRAFCLEYNMFVFRFSVKQGAKVFTIQD